MSVPMESEITTRATTEGALIGPGACVIKPRAGHRLRIIEEPIPPETLPLDRSTGRPTRHGHQL